MCTHTHMFMATKTITIMEDAYELLARAKHPDESFSDAIRRVVGKEEDIMDCFGVWSDETAEFVKSSIKESRARNKERRGRMEKSFSA